MESSLNPSSAKPKPLPLVTKGDDLPPPPPSPLRPTGGGPPMPPPKGTIDAQRGSSPAPLTNDDRLSERSPQLRGTLSPPDITSPPGTPSFPSNSSATLSPPSPGVSALDGSRPKKVNPFVDLLETEKIYVDTLSGIIRKVAAAWSRSNLPPPELDMMFRSVEAIYKANRSLQSKLKEIGPNPSSPRAIGDLLMKWIDQLDAPYTKYASSYLLGFDTWKPVQSNERLPAILEAFSASNPHPQANAWTLDALLSLPRARIKYYLKLYGRLLKSSAPGKSTDQKLIEGVGRLEDLLATIDERSKVTLPGPAQVLETTDEIVIDTRVNTENAKKPSSENDDEIGRSHRDDTPQLHEGLDARTSIESSTRGSSLSSGLRSSRDTSMTSEGRESIATLSMSLADLERRLSTERCQDLFTMTPRNVKLSINSSNLPYTREIRLSEDAAIHFTPKSTNIEVVHRQGHIFVLTDLFLVCERMPFEERALRESEGLDMWLCYPPLAAKHLRIGPIKDFGMEITILKKELMCLYFESSTKRDNAMKEFKSTVEVAASLPPPSKQGPPPLPSMDNMSNSGPATSGRRSSDPPNSSLSPSRSGNASPRAQSPASGASMHRVDPGRNSSHDNNSPRSSCATQSPNGREGGPPPYSPTNETSRPPQMASPPGSRPADPSSGHFVPPPRGESSRGGMPPPGSGPIGLPPRPNMRDGPPSVNPGQVFPLQRSGSVPGPPGIGGMPPPPRGAMSPPPMNGMHGPPRNMMSPPPMNGMNNGAGPGPYGNGPPMAAPNPRMPGLGPGAIFTGAGPMHGQQGPGQFLNYPQQVPPHPGQPFANPGRASSDPSYQGGLRKTPSLHSVLSQHDQLQQPSFQQAPRSAPPIPSMPNHFLPERQNSYGNPGPSQTHLRPMLPSAALPRIASSAPAFGLDDSPPTSPTECAPRGPVESVVLASMKCKVFLQQQHAQWKALGSSKLTLYEQRPTMLKQLVVEADNKDNTILISTIVLSDGVERVGKTGVAIELSDNGARTGIIYMIQLRNEKSAGGLYESLLSGSDRGGFRG